LTKRDFPALHSGLSFLQKDFHFYRGYRCREGLLLPRRKSSKKAVGTLDLLKINAKNLNEKNSPAAQTAFRS